MESASRGMEVLDLLESLESPADTPSRFAHRHQVIEVLECVLERLTECDHLRPLDRQVILLRAKGESYEHIAELLSISKANAMTRFSRTKQELREQLLKEGVGPADTAG
jgi:DNA-directed RNA polymerase specialized sigma24 family protein